jgi:hypothetical protein
MFPRNRGPDPARCTAFSDDGKVTQLAPEGRPLTRRTKVLIGIGAALVVISMLVTAVHILVSPAKRVLVVTMKQEAGQADRVALKQACGGLAGVKVVADQGNPDPHIQGRFPVRFDIGTATFEQEKALTVCINAHGEMVRGLLNEGDN